jgi:serine/threonine protein phosphatase PrpC
MNSFGITDKGIVRRENQDSFLIERVSEKGCLVAVLCDGMGRAGRQYCQRSCRKGVCCACR